MATSYSSKIVSDGLIFHIDAKSPRCYNGGSTCKDLIQKVDGTLAGGTTISTEGFKFTSDGDWIHFTPHDADDLTQNISLFAWGNKTVTGGDYDTLIRIRFYNEETYALMIQDNDTIRWEAWTTSSSPRQDRTHNVGTFSGWNYFGIVLESASSSSHTMKFYFNGHKVHEQSYDYGIRTSSQGVYVGGGPRGDGTPIRQLQGSIMSASIYEIPLSDEKILQNYNAAKGRFGV
tara:strand:+ start:1186 stop:1881 length:696 start_codon:yes stop_codon:yes gene_type:complete